MSEKTFRFIVLTGLPGTLISFFVYNNVVRLCFPSSNNLFFRQWKNYFGEKGMCTS